MSLGKRFLFWCAFDHLEFRIPEFEAIADMLGIKMNWVDKNGTHPFVIVDLASEAEAKRLCSRSISTKYCIELWTDANSFDNMHEQIKSLPEDFVQPYLHESLTFKVYIEAFMKKYTYDERLAKIESFSHIKCKGKVRLKDPDVIFSSFEFFGFDHNNLPDHPERVFFGRCISEGQRHLITTMNLKKRLFIGNTSMDPQLSLLMANLAQVQSDRLVFDPFVGTGSILLAAAAFGGHVLGSDIDFLMMHARTKPSRVGQKKRKSDESFKGNFEQYNLESKLVDVIVGDASALPWRRDIHGLFDVIVTDPPYGIREPTEKVGTTKTDLVEIPEEHKNNHIPQKVEYSMGDIYVDLMAFASKYLPLGGRLVFFIPVNREHYSKTGLPPGYPGLKMIANCEQVLNSHTSRRCLTFEKVSREAESDQFDDSASRSSMAEVANQFKENFFKAQELPRVERKERLKKYGHLNLTE